MIIKIEIKLGECEVWQTSLDTEKIKGSEELHEKALELSEYFMRSCLAGKTCDMEGGTPQEAFDRIDEYTEMFAWTILSATKDRKHGFN